MYKISSNCLSLSPILNREIRKVMLRRLLFSFLQYVIIREPRVCRIDYLFIPFVVIVTINILLWENVNKVDSKDNSAQTFSRKMRKGYRNSFKLLLIEEGCMLTSLLPSNQIGRSLVARPADCLRLLRVASAMPFSVAATLGYKPAHNIACKKRVDFNSKSDVWYELLSYLCDRHILMENSHLNNDNSSRHACGTKVNISLLSNQLYICIEEKIRGETKLQNVKINFVGFTYRNFPSA